MSDIKLGFGDDPRFPKYVFVGADETDDKKPYLWYSLDGPGNVVPQFDPALTGSLTDVKCIKTMFKDKPNYKYDFFLQAGGQNFVIRSGVNTIFSRGIMLALEYVLSELVKPEGIGACLFSFITSAGDEDNVVYGNLFDWAEGETVFPDWDKEKKLSPIMNILQGALGTDIQTKKSIEDAYAERQNRNR